jgi:hypothetical protein
LEAKNDSRTAHELLGQEDIVRMVVPSTLFYTQVLNHGRKEDRSQLDEIYRYALRSAFTRQKALLC